MKNESLNLIIYLKASQGPAWEACLPPSLSNSLPLAMEGGANAFRQPFQFYYLGQVENSGILALFSLVSAHLPRRGEGGVAGRESQPQEQAPA